VSSPLAIAGVTQILRDLLNDRMINGNVAAVIGNSITVSTLPPDKVVTQNSVEATQLNLFLRHVTPNIGWRNEGLPARDASGRNRVNDAPLALDLHYLLSAYGAQDLHAEILLGYAMQLLHEFPVITREAIRTSLEPPPDVGATLPPYLRALAETGLADQVEQLRITPEFLSTEEMSKFWTSTLAHYRPSAAYQISVVLIQAKYPAPQPLPVLQRNIAALPSLVPSVPTLSSVVPEGRQPAVQIDKTVTLNGFNLAGTSPEVRLFNDRFNIEASATLLGTSATSLDFKIPASQANDFPVGVYRVDARMLLAGDTTPRVSNQLALTLAPSFVGPATPVTRASDGSASLSLSMTPALRAGQTARLVLGATEYAPNPFADLATTLSFVIPDAPVGQHVARVRIDGIDSPIIDMSAPIPKFLDYRLVIQ
jgi:hypothetical protein